MAQEKGHTTTRRTKVRITVRVQLDGQSEYISGIRQELLFPGFCTSKKTLLSVPLNAVKLDIKEDSIRRNGNDSRLCFSPGVKCQCTQHILRKRRGSLCAAFVLLACSVPTRTLPTVVNLSFVDHRLLAVVTSAWLAFTVPSE